MNAADVAEVLHAGRVRSTAHDLPPARSDLLCSDDPIQPAADSEEAGRGRAEDETAGAAGLSESSGARVSTSVQSVAGSAAASQTTSITTSTTAATDVDGVVRESKVTTHTHTPV